MPALCRYGKLYTVDNHMTDLKNSVRSIHGSKKENPIPKQVNPVGEKNMYIVFVQ